MIGTAKGPTGISNRAVKMRSPLITESLRVSDIEFRFQQSRLLVNTLPKANFYRSSRQLYQSLPAMEHVYLSRGEVFFEDLCNGASMLL
jgi:hypothetical protein